MDSTTPRRPGECRLENVIGHGGVENTLGFAFVASISDGDGGEESKIASYVS